MKTRQIRFLKKARSEYGGDLMKKRQGRRGPRPLATRHTMHLVLRSTKAKGRFAFNTARNRTAIGKILRKFSTRYAVAILDVANVGNHLHFQIKLGNRFAYRPFIRAVTSAIAMAVMGVSRWRPGDGTQFWDYRPFTRIVDGGRRAFLNLRDYIRINQLEGFGYNRDVARIVLASELNI